MANDEALLNDEADLVDELAGEIVSEEARRSEHTSPGVESDVDSTLAHRPWRRRPEFGVYLKSQRERKRLSLRIAASAIGVSHTYLSQLEQGARVGAPTAALLEAVAATYGVHLEEVLTNAGYEAAASALVPVTDEIETEFENLLMHPSLRPALMDERVMEYIPVRVKRQWLQFALRLERYLGLEGHRTVTDIRRNGLLKPGSPPPDPVDGSE
ncbi:MAG: helix-turn-helix transcriptional regulator [Pseudomonadota bacterium]|nr:helix-turn-helix transcriptional regulator [Pseudomonadota bacterium]